MEGYPKLMETMETHPDVRIFRRFSALNIQGLLYLQAELLHLEKEWRDTVLDDIKSGDSARTALQTNVLKLQKGTRTANETLQWAKFQEIQAKLAVYSKCTYVAPAAGLLTMLPRQTHRSCILKGLTLCSPQIWIVFESCRIG